MHRETVSIFASACAEGGAPEPGPGGRNFLHFVRAALNAGEEGSIPAPRWKRKPPPDGSGKLGRPPERMQLAYASAAASGESEPGLGAPSPAVALDRTVEPRCATPPFEEEEPPPQPASGSAALASATTPRLIIVMSLGSLWWWSSTLAGNGQQP